MISQALPDNFLPKLCTCVDGESAAQPLLLVYPGFALCRLLIHPCSRVVSERMDSLDTEFLQGYHRFAYLANPWLWVCFAPYLCVCMWLSRNDRHWILECETKRNNFRIVNVALIATWRLRFEPNNGLVPWTLDAISPKRTTSTFVIQYQQP